MTNGLKRNRRRRRNLRWTSSKSRKRPRREAPSASSIIRRDTSMDGNDVDDRCLGLELNLEASKVETIILREGNQQLKGKVELAEQALKEKQTKLDILEDKVKNKGDEVDVLRMELRWAREKDREQQREINQMKGLLEKLYSVAGTVMEGLGGTVQPIKAVEDEEYTESLELFCSKLQSKFLEWQGNHQLMHNELVRTLNMVEELADQINGSNDNEASDQEHALASSSSAPPSETVIAPCPSPLAIASPPPPTQQMDLEIYRDAVLGGLTRRNPLRKCRQVIDSYCEGSVVSLASGCFQFACEHCGDAFCRLAHVSAKLDRVTDIKKTYAVKPEFVTALSPENGIKKRTPSKHKKKTKAETVDMTTRPKLEVVESSGQEHKLAGFFLTILPSEQKRSLLEGTPPIKKRRYFCKCGKHYAGWSGLFQHIKMIANSNKFKCGLCQESFKIRPALMTHMKEFHGIDYCQGRFSCLECGKTFVGTMKEVETHQKLYHSVDDNEDGYLSA